MQWRMKYQLNGVFINAITALVLKHIVVIKILIMTINLFIHITCF